MKERVYDSRGVLLRKYDVFDFFDAKDQLEKERFLVNWLRIIQVF